MLLGVSVSVCFVNVLTVPQSGNLNAKNFYDTISQKPVYLFKIYYPDLRKIIVVALNEFTSHSRVFQCLSVSPGTYWWDTCNWTGWLPNTLTASFLKHPWLLLRPRVLPTGSPSM